MPVSSQPCPLVVEKAMKRPGFGNTVRVPLTLINTHLVTIEMLSLWAIGSIKPTCSDIKSSWSLGLKKTLHGPNFSLQIFAKVPAPSCDTSQIFLPDGVSSHRFWRLVLLLPPRHEGPVLSWCLVDLPEIRLLFTWTCRSWLIVVNYKPSLQDWIRRRFNSNFLTVLKAKVAGIEDCV